MRRDFRNVLSCSGLLILAGIAVAQETIPAAESSQWRVTLDGIAECVDCGLEQAYRIGVARQGGAPASELLLKSFATQLTELRIYRDVAIVRGNMPYGGDLVAILDLPGGELLANIPAYGLQISPDNRYLIYQKWYPRFSERNEVAAMVYDLALHDADRNRIPTSSDMTDGFRFFPESITYEERGTENPAGVLTGDGMLWDPARKRAFMTMIDTDGNNSLLVLKLWEDTIAADYPEVCAIPFMPVRNGSDGRRRNMVVGMKDDGDAIVVTMNDDAEIRIDPAAQCR